MKAFVTEALHVNRGGTSALASGRAIGHYRIQKYLTTGTFGTLYLADQQNKNTGSTVVLKVVSVPNELRLHHDVFSLGTHLVDLKHPSILPTLEVNLDGVFPYVVTAYITGGSLYERLKLNTVLSLPDKFTILSQVGDALAHLHSQDIIHRGVQPASILFDDAGNALLTGFDLAIRASAAKHRLQSNQVGTEGYMAPEQFDGIVSEKSDQYALACIAYELFTGRLPFKGSRSLPTSQHRPKPIRSPHLLNPSLSVQAGQAILRSLSFSPDQRYGNISAFILAVSSSSDGSSR
jgi:serine/threonine protein kinase